MNLLHYIAFATTTITCHFPTSYAHVQLLSPPSIINSDYQYTFEDGRCVKDTCDAFCGQSDVNPTITAIQPTNDGHINVKLLISVRHNPYRYRISVHDGGVDSIQGFDTNILLDDIEMDGKEGWVSVPLPQDLKCDPYCVLQLFDYYYFVSCSLFTLDSSSNSTEEENDIITEEIYESDTFVSDIPTITQEEIVYEGDIPAVRISMMMSLDYITYLAIGISTNGYMVRSYAVVGSVDDESIDDNNELLIDTGIYTTKEYILGGKFPELVTTTPEDEKITLMSNFTINYLQESGLYNHKLEVILQKNNDICGKKGIGGKKIIWSFSSYDSPSTVLAIHGTKTRGLHPLPIICEEEIDDLEEESFVDNDKSSMSMSDSSSTSSRRRKDMLSVVLPIAALFVGGLFVH